jgi:GT2 family glycosyltransferase
METIVIDDTPNPSIKLKCEQYEKHFEEVGVNLLYVKNPADRSISSARNLGARMAKGNIVQFVDSDVVLTQGFLQEICETFERHPEALGVAGVVAWNYQPGSGENVSQALFKLFFLFHSASNSCRYFEFPYNVNGEIRCEWFNGENMAFRHSVLSQFQFDERLKRYSWMETFLFTGQISKAYPGRLILTSHAKCCHEPSKEGRMDESERRLHVRICRKYVETRLFGCRGLLMFGWQNLGVLALRTIVKIRRKTKRGSGHKREYDFSLYGI